jgi:hypothetical protein
MLAQIEVQRLVDASKIDRALQGNLLPLNNNDCFLNLADISSVTVVEEDPAKGAVPIAFGLCNRCSANQVYCSIVAVTPRHENGFVCAQQIKSKMGELGLSEDCTTKQHSLLKLTNVFEELPDLSGLPQYFSAFAEPIARPLLSCVVDQLIDQTVGHKNVEISRNLTVDLYDNSSNLPEHPDYLWRDFSGFVVADRYRYCEIIVSKNSCLDVLKNAISAGSSKKEFVHDDGTTLPFRVESINKTNVGLVLEFDQTIALMNREDYLEYLVGLTEVSFNFLICLKVPKYLNSILKFYLFGYLDQ